MFFLFRRLFLCVQRIETALSGDALDIGVFAEDHEMIRRIENVFRAGEEHPAIGGLDRDDVHVVFSANVHREHTLRMPALGRGDLVDAVVFIKSKMLSLEMATARRSLISRSGNTM